MASLSDILARKGNQVYWVGPEVTVLEATQLMNHHKIGAVVVMEGSRVKGIFTERDVLRRVVAVEKSPSKTRVREVMSTDVACASPDTPLEVASTVMKNRRIRHLPVCNDDGDVVGMISIGDLNAWFADGQELTIRFLSEYIHGRV